MKKTQKANNVSENFIPPDGGWGWMIVIAAGFSNFCILPLLQSFGLIFRDRFTELGISSTKIATVLNINCTVTSCIGLINGPLFRKFSYRQVAFIGALICAISITILSTVTNFTAFLTLFSIIYVETMLAGISSSVAKSLFFFHLLLTASITSTFLESANALSSLYELVLLNLNINAAIQEATTIRMRSTDEQPLVFMGMHIVEGWRSAGVGVTMSSNSLALNTYFKKKRRVATGLSWTCTGIGPIIVPQVITQLMPIYGMEGTVLIFGGFAFNAVACALLLQPVFWHIKKDSDASKLLEPSSGINSQVLPFSDQETTKAAHEDPKTSFQSKSLENVTGRTNRNLLKGKFRSSCLYYDNIEDGPSVTHMINPEIPMLSQTNDGWYMFSRRNKSTPAIAFKEPTKESLLKDPQRRLLGELSRHSSLYIPLSLRNLSRHSENLEHYKGLKVDQLAQTLTKEEIKTDRLMEEKTSKEPSSTTLLDTLVIFFDLDLLRDPVYVNILLGMTFAHFTELNFSLLTPFILGEQGHSKIQVATVMSILAGVDVITRLVIPFVADFIGWQNRTFFLVGVCGIAAGRIVLAHVHDFKVTIAVAVLIGAGKALRTIFIALVIPSHVPLSKLPGATGLQLLTNGIVFLMLGPVVGWIRDATSSYVLMLHCLNIFTYLITISWLLEIYIVKRRSRKLVGVLETTNN